MCCQLGLARYLSRLGVCRPPCKPYVTLSDPTESEVSRIGGSREFSDHVFARLSLLLFKRYFSAFSPRGYSKVKFFLESSLTSMDRQKKQIIISRNNKSYQQIIEIKVT